MSHKIGGGRENCPVRVQNLYALYFSCLRCSLLLCYYDRFGFPEVDLGILPAASGTQRFPRLVGLESALDIISTGRRFSANYALKIGAIDLVGNFFRWFVCYWGSAVEQYARWFAPILVMSATVMTAIQFKLVDNEECL